MHKSYEEILRHLPDFKVKYRFFSPGEGGRQKPPFQGIRSDFKFEQPYMDPEGTPTGNFIIWPEFEDSDGNIILDDTLPVPATGIARMWIINPKRRSIHCGQIEIGTKGYFIEGKPTAECVVIEIVGLHTNPKS